MLPNAFALSRPAFILTAFVSSLVLQSVVYLGACRFLFPTSAADAKKAAKARAWVLTAGSSFVMTLASLPFLADFVRHAGDVAKVQRREELARALSAFFVAYLVLVSRSQRPAPGSGMLTPGSRTSCLGGCTTVI